MTCRPGKAIRMKKKKNPRRHEYGRAYAISPILHILVLQIYGAGPWIENKLGPSPQEVCNSDSHTGILWLWKGKCDLYRAGPNQNKSACVWAPKPLNRLIEHTASTERQQHNKWVLFSIPHLNFPFLKERLGEWNEERRPSNEYLTENARSMLGQRSCFQRYFQSSEGAPFWVECSQHVTLCGPRQDLLKKQKRKKIRQKLKKKKIQTFLCSQTSGIDVNFS